MTLCRAGLHSKPVSGYCRGCKAIRDKRFRRTEKGRAVNARSTRTYYARRKQQGLCVTCGRGPVISDVLCWDCLNNLEGRTFAIG